MTTQYYIVFIIILIAVIYAAQRIKQTIKSSKSGCYGCKGCALREQIIKKEKEKGYKTTKKHVSRKKIEKHLAVTKNIHTFATAIEKQTNSYSNKNKFGTLADRLGNGLQNRVEQFDSARYLLIKRKFHMEFPLIF